MTILPHDDPVAIHSAVPPHDLPIEEPARIADSDAEVTCAWCLSGDLDSDEKQAYRRAMIARSQALGTY